MALGRGLDSLIPQKSSKDPQKDSLPLTSEKQNIKEGVSEIPLSSIVINPHQPRQFFDESELRDLTQSIKDYGVIQPILVASLGNDKYQLVAGERRWRASKLAGKKTIPAFIREVTEVEKLTLAIIENLQRANLNPIEQAEGFTQLIEQFGLTQEQVAKKLSKSRSSIANTLRLLNLPDEIRNAIKKGKLTEGHAKALLSLPDFSQQIELYRKIVNHKMSVREVEEQARKASGLSKKINAIDPVIVDKANTLTKALGYKVKIKKKRRSGVITISFQSNTDFKNLFQKLLRLK